MLTPFVPKKPVEPYRPCCLDTETTHEGTVFAVGFGYEDDDGEICYERFDNWGDWWEWYSGEFLREYHGTKYRRLYAANGANFDWLSLVEYMESTGQMERLRYVASESFGIGVDIRVGKTLVHLRDMQRLIPGSLAKVTKEFGVESEKIKIEVLPDVLYAKDRELFERYLRNDTIGMMEVLYKFWLMIYTVCGDIGELPMTLPALALRIFRKTLTSPLMVTWNKDVKELERRAYRGGRVSCFKVGEFPVVVDDVNSLFPTVMSTLQFPLGYHGGWTGEYVGNPGIYEGRFSQPVAPYPPLLFDEISGNYAYEGIGAFTHHEIAHLLSIGGTFACERGYEYAECGPLFRDFVLKFWEIRQRANREGNTGLSYVCKILLNSLYGKFGQRESSETLKTLTGEEIESLVTKGINIRQAGDYWLVEEQTHSEHTFVAIAAMVTSGARVTLHRLMMDTIDNGGEIIYVDTDSIHYVSENYRLPTGEGLGELKREYVGDAVYLGRKLYAKKAGEIKAKGIGKLERSPLGYDDYVRLANGGELAVSFSTFPTWREVLIQDKPACKLIRRTRRIRATGPKENRGISPPVPPDSST